MPGVQVPGKAIVPGGAYDTTQVGYFLTKVQDSTGNAVQLGYDLPVVNSSATARLLTITDSLNQVTSLSYELNSDPLKITRVTDPFGRFARFDYDEAGRLKTITDVLGLSSNFTYLGTGDFISALTTPYGTSKFEFGEAGLARWLEMTDPEGSKERIEYPLKGFFNPNPQPAGVSVSASSHDVTFYWNKKAMSEAPGRYEAAYQYHWLSTDTSRTNASGSLAAERPALENPIHYNYPGQPADYVQGTSGRPTKIARMLDDGSSQITQLEYNSLGKVTMSTDPAGRATTFVYESDSTKPGYQVDLREVRQKIGTNPTDYEVAGKFTYNAQHLPLTSTDASGQTTYYSYNSAGQLRTTTNPKGDVTTFWYHISGNPLDATYPFDPVAPLDPNAFGYLVTVDGPLPGEVDAVHFIYDGYGRARKTTDTQGYTVTTDYDFFDRPTAITYPDTTFQQIVYDRLDASKSRDRMGRWTLNTYNSVRQLVRTRDPLGRTTVLEWCFCGALSSIIDGNGAATAFVYDLEGRMIDKDFSDGTIVSYRYDGTGRLSFLLDAKRQKTSYRYNIDDSVAQVSYTNATIATPTVSYFYDPFYPRVATMTDGVGTTTYTYNPIPTTPTLGAGKLASITGPIAGAVVSFGYDELGRLTTKAIDGAANTTTFHYDTLGRADQVTNPLGIFNYGYLGATGKLDHVNYPNGQVTNYGYYPSSSVPPGNDDQRLQQIQNLRPGGANLSTFGYAYDAVGQIQTWSQQNDGGSALTSSFKYDAAGQLTEALVPTTASIIKSYVYRYDKAGNRTSEQIDSGVTAAIVNNANQVTGLSPTGPIRFAGTLNEPSTVTVNGVAASVDSANAFTADVPLAPGTQTVAVVATDTSDNTTTKNYQVVVSNGVSRNLHYDQVGNEIDDGAGRTVAWDALNRLVKIMQASGVTEFVYDGSGRRVQEKLNGSVVKQWVWCDGAQPGEERDVAGNVTKRFYNGLGEQISGSSYFLSTDHLGSVREMTDSTGTVRARYSYDPYGRITKVSGDLEADFGFTGMQRHQASGLNLTMHRAYDSELGRWLSRDPIEESGGLNLYTYVANNPASRVDLLGLFDGETSGYIHDVSSSRWNYNRTHPMPNTAIENAIMAPFVVVTTAPVAVTGWVVVSEASLMTAVSFPDTVWAVTKLAASAMVGVGSKPWGEAWNEVSESWGGAGEAWKDAVWWYKYFKKKCFSKQGHVRK